MIDDFGPQASGHPTTSARHGFAIVPHDINDLDHVTRAINLKLNGTVRVLLVDDADPVDLYLVAGVLHPLAVKRVLATGTDPGLEIKGLY